MTRLFIFFACQKWKSAICYRYTCSTHEKTNGGYFMPYLMIQLAAIFDSARWPSRILLDKSRQGVSNV